MCSAYFQAYSHAPTVGPIWVVGVAFLPLAVSRIDAATAASLGQLNGKNLTSGHRSTRAIARE